MADIALTTGRRMRRVPEENDLLVAALSGLGVDTVVVPWDEPLDWSRHGAVIVRTTWDYHERHAEFLDWAHQVAASTPLHNPAELIAWNSHKGYLAELAAAGVPVVPTTLVRAGEPGAPVLARHGSAEVVIKPAVSVGAIGALRATADSAEAAAHLARLTAHGDALVQPFAEAITSQGETSLIFFGGEFSHAVRKVPAPEEYRIHQHHGGSVLPHTATPAELAAARAALAAAPAPATYARVDLVPLADGPALRELELIEPELFLPHHPEATARYARTLAGLI
jgi:glutathione synthase/RimK-type ligase-like ATP-grasp enzyme